MGLQMHEWVCVGCILLNGLLDIWWDRSKKKKQPKSLENSKTLTKIKTYDDSYQEYEW